ncbi:VOC family protein [Streptomyces sp. NBC_00063]|uniref:VOC family protein n=1 Tax=Streptomyces sp. NBC_00063 TaxID=2975638 RepID=UPI003D728C18
MPGITQRSTSKPLIKTRFLSHGTLEVDNLQASRRFYEEVLGLEVVQQVLLALARRPVGSPRTELMPGPGYEAWSTAGEQNRRRFCSPAPPYPALDVTGLS